LNDYSDEIGGIMNIVAILGIVMSLFVAPILTFGFIILLRKTKTDVEKLKYKKEILELEIRKDETRLRMLAEENRKYDKLLESDIRGSDKNAT
jgi:hypothetical protein